MKFLHSFLLFTLLSFPSSAFSEELFTKTSRDYSAAFIEDGHSLRQYIYNKCDFLFNGNKAKNIAGPIRVLKENKSRFVMSYRDCLLYEYGTFSGYFNTRCILEDDNKDAEYCGDLFEEIYNK